MRCLRVLAFAGPFACCALIEASSWGADVQATPADYKQKLGSLQPGDTLHLAAGTYVGLPLSSLNGAPSAWITVTGPAVDPPTAVVQASPDGCCNVVELTQSSYVAIENLQVDGNHVPGAFGISAKGDTTNVVHDIRVEGCTIVHCDQDGQSDNGQQDDGISTKTPTWGWIIRRNKILGNGTGLYLGNSTGADPFTGGLIEDNLVADSLGYDMEIKWQTTPRQSVPGQPTQPSSTVIRNNVWIKADNPCLPDTSYCRPNVLVGGFATSGPGSQDEYQIYGNFFLHNATDQGLLQVSGRVTVHDNVFVDAPSAWGIYASDHDGAPLELAHVYNNTIYGVSKGIVFANAAPQGDAVVGNLVFSGIAVAGPIASQSDNLIDTVANAPQYVNRPSITPGQMDFYPLVGKCTGATIDESAFAAELDYALDFNGTPKGGFTYRGAYAGGGTNPGWPLGNGMKDGGAGGGDAGLPFDGGGVGVGEDAAASPDATLADDGGGAGSSGAASGTNSGGCGCHAAGDAPGMLSPGWLALLVAGAWRRARRRPATSASRPRSP